MDEIRMFNTPEGLRAATSEHIVISSYKHQGCRLGVVMHEHDIGLHLPIHFEFSK